MRWLAAQFEEAGLSAWIERVGRYATLPALGVVLLACAPVAWALPLFTGPSLPGPATSNRLRPTSGP